MVSVIIPLYNAELYIERCLQSLSAQSYKLLEILVVDDGSTDKGAEIVKKYRAKDQRITYTYQKNQGPGTARNAAIECARGRYLLFVDADDYLRQDYIEDLVRHAEKKGSDLTIAGYTLVYQKGKKKEEVMPGFYERGRAEEWAYRISSSWSRLYRRDFWLKHGLKFSQAREARAEDVPIVLYANVMAEHIGIVKNPGYFYYQHAESAMNNKKKKVLFGFPYQAFAEMYIRVRSQEARNSIAFFDFGVLKFLAQFDLVIYRKADRTEKRRFEEYINKLIGEDFKTMAAHFRQVKKGIDLPMVHKMAIEAFILKYRRKIKAGREWPKEMD